MVAVPLVSEGEFDGDPAQNLYNERFRPDDFDFEEQANTIDLSIDSKSSESRRSNATPVLGRTYKD